MEEEQKNQVVFLPHPLTGRLALGNGLTHRLVRCKSRGLAWVRGCHCVVTGPVASASAVRVTNADSLIKNLGVSPPPVF